jgi:O-antigen ligase
MNTSLIAKYYNFFTFLFPISLFLGYGINSICFFIWCMLSIFLAKKNNFNKKNIIDTTIIGSLCISYIISFLLVDDRALILKMITRSLPLLLFPLFFIINTQIINKHTLNRSLLVFSFSNTLVCIFAWLKIFHLGFAEMLEANNFYNPIFRNIFFNLTKIHLPYLGLFFAFSIYILTISIFNQKNKKLLSVYIFSIIILTASIVLISARTAILSLITTIILTILFKLNLSNKAKYCSILVILISTIGMSQIPSIKNRIDYLWEKKIELPNKKQNPENFNVRYGIYDCTIDIIKNNIITGVGPTNVQKNLNKCYEKFDYKNYDDYNTITYNSHCQYTDIFMKYGIFGLILFIISLLWGIKNSNIYYFGFMIIILQALLTENLFDRQHGIMFFSFYNALFFITQKQNEKSNSN